MGNIANKISAKDKQLIDILSNNRFKIDMFQREYRWKREHIEALISDLYYSFICNIEGQQTLDDIDNFDYYYLGPIVLCEKGRNDVSIVDGQQRITSISLLLIYMHHLQNTLDLSDDYRHSFIDYLYTKKGGRTTLTIDVPSRKNVMEMLIETGNVTKIYETIQHEDESVVNILSRYDDITTLFPNELKNDGLFPLFSEWLLNNITMVEIRAFTMDNAYVIFETMNDRGMSLNPTEIIKAYLLSKIDDEDQADEMNCVWKEQIQSVKSAVGDEGDMSFFRDWLRAKYAVTKRNTTANSSNEDFEQIGSQYHTWIKNNDKNIGLRCSKDYYMFIKSDFEYYSNLYRKIYQHRYFQYETLPSLYITSQYCIADSLYMPLLMAPITKLDDKETAYSKLTIVDNFIDRFVNMRSLNGRTITQTAIRSSLYDLIKEIRDSDISDLIEKLRNYKSSELGSIDDSIFLHALPTNYLHYFFARVKYYRNNSKYSFASYLRSRKQKSYVLFQIFKYSDFSDEEMKDKYTYLQSLCNYCLVRRPDVDKLNNSSKEGRIATLINLGYLDSGDYEECGDEISFWIIRKDILRDYIVKIWLPPIKNDEIEA